jgi:hypothetical protein
MVVENNDNTGGLGARLRGESRAMAKQGGRTSKARNEISSFPVLLRVFIGNCVVEFDILGNSLSSIRKQASTLHIQFLRVHLLCHSFCRSSRMKLMPTTSALHYARIVYIWCALSFCCQLFYQLWWIFSAHCQNRFDGYIAPHCGTECAT